MIGERAPRMACPRCGHQKGHDHDCPRNAKWARLAEGATIEPGPRQMVPLISETYCLEAEETDWGQTVGDVWRVIVETREGVGLSKFEFAIEEAAEEYGRRAIAAGEVDRRLWFLL